MCFCLYDIQNQKLRLKRKIIIIPEKSNHTYTYAHNIAIKAIIAIVPIVTIVTIVAIV